ncbi:MAG: rane protein [Rhodocyclales bacterium]|nr:rane protein [Rhodocyclales bacterium]
MAASSLLALIDDIATVLDDVALMTKVAAKKTAGVLGDDLALNAEQVSGVRAERELPVVWAVAKGSMRNKLILVPAALAISAVAPWAITPLLMLGGAYLCFEGFEKLAHKFLHSHAEDVSAHAHKLQVLADPAIDLVAFEKEKIAGAIRTDFILSAEIIVIALGTVKDAPLLQQIPVVAGIAIIMTVGVYALVGGIVKLDDIGLHLVKAGGRLKSAVGEVLLSAAPKLMKSLSFIGTAAMFMVGGSILVHGVPVASEYLHHVAEVAHAVAGIGPVLGAIAPALLDMLAGVIAGALVLMVVSPITAVLDKLKKHRNRP